MSVAPFPIRCLRDSTWITIQTDELLPGDVVSVGMLFWFLRKTNSNTQLLHAARQQTETSIPADILLVDGTCIVNEAMLSGESTPLLKESVRLREGGERLDVDGTHKNTVLFSGTKLLQASMSRQYPSLWPPHFQTDPAFVTKFISRPPSEPRMGGV
jgi:cation-transporting ATPase 13A1